MLLSVSPVRRLSHLFKASLKGHGPWPASSSNLAHQRAGSSHLGCKLLVREPFLPHPSVEVRSRSNGTIPNRDSGRAGSIATASWYVRVAELTCEVLSPPEQIVGWAYTRRSARSSQRHPGEFRNISWASSRDRHSALDECRKPATRLKESHSDSRSRRKRRVTSITEPLDTA